MNYKEYFVLEKQLREIGFDAHRSDLISSFTEGRTESVRALSLPEYRQFISCIKTRFEFQSREDRMRQKVYVLFVDKMEYTEEELERWCVKYGKYHKGLNDHSYKALIELTTQAERAYISFVKGVTK